MADDVFEAHLALHGFVRYTGSGMNLPTDSEYARVYVDDEKLLDMFRLPGFVRIDQYGPEALHRAAARSVAGFEEFGAWGRALFYTRKKNYG